LIESLCPEGSGQIVAAVAALIQATAHIARTALALRPFKRAPQRSEAPKIKGNFTKQMNS
jgi:hypothetical protein